LFWIKTGVTGVPDKTPLDDSPENFFEKGNSVLFFHGFQVLDSPYQQQLFLNCPSLLWIKAKAPCANMAKTVFRFSCAAAMITNIQDLMAFSFKSTSNPFTSST
jgi:hypothetical protein